MVILNKGMIFQAHAALRWSGLDSETTEKKIGFRCTY